MNITRHDRLTIEADNARSAMLARFGAAMREPMSVEAHECRVLYENAIRAENMRSN